MILAVEAITQALIDALTGSLKYNGEELAVTTVPMGGVTSDFVMITEPSSVEDGTKTDHGARYDIDIQVFTAYRPKGGSKKKLYSVVNQITKLLKPYPYSTLNLGSNLNCITWVLSNASGDTSLQESERVSRYILTYSLHVESIEVQVEFLNRMINQGFTFEARECVSNQL